MTQIVFELSIIVILLGINGVFAMTEIAVVSVRKPQLRRLAEAGNRKAATALELAESPNRFLSTVQIGITLVGIFAGAFGGATLASKLAVPIQSVALLAPYAEKIAFFAVVAGITYFSLVFGELVPKRFGMSRPETIAMIMARPMSALSRIAGPIVSFLSFSTELLLRLLGFKPGEEVTVSEDEVRIMMQEGLRSGSFNKTESHIVHSALELDELTVREIMTPRPKVIWLNVTDPHDQLWHKIAGSKHSYFPVYQDSRDNTIGVVSVKSMYAALAAGTDIEFERLMIPPLVVPETQTVLRLVETFKHSGKHIALVIDEFGSIVGLVTLTDIMEALVGEFPTQGERAKPSARLRDDGSWLIDGMLDLEAIENTLPKFKFDETAYSEYQTLAGYLVKMLGHVPTEGETFVTQGYLFEVIDMDRHRIDKVLVQAAEQQ